MKYVRVLGVLGLFLSPTLANAGIADFFGIGAVAKSISDTTWKIYAIKTFASMGPLILLIVAIIGAIAIAIALVKISESYAGTVREVLRDEKVSNTEKVILGTQGLFSFIAVCILGFVGCYLIAIIHTGAREILHYTPPAVTDAPATKDVKK
ncbi:MAG: hypothetical protein M0022_01870 [Desulfobacteraceae bacterium]|nr:hypothetical protein [Desulfobacteraceae bacterium]